MTPLDIFMNGSGTYTFNNGGSGGALDLFEPDDDDGYPYGIRDLTGYTDQFHLTTSDFLDTNSQYNVVMWSWCGLDTSFSDIDEYLTNMNWLEQQYPSVSFVYMTGHLNGGGESGAVHLANERIRNYSIQNDKILYDFADIESYNPDDEYFLDKDADDGCYYDSDGNGSLDSNWAIEWQDTHTQDVHWYSCSCAHSQPLNGNMKAYSAWYLFAVLAGWSGN